MKKLIKLLLVTVLGLTGCSKPKNNDTVADDEVNDQTVEADTEEDLAPDYSWDVNTAFTGLNDDNLLRYMEDSIYAQTVDSLPDGYFISNMDSMYISKEYIEELQYNSKKNIFFGYTLEELDECFQGKRYVFTLGENGETTVKEVKDYYDDTYNQVLKNVAIGSGVILLCVTVSVVTAGAGAPAASMIFAASAKTGAIMAMSSGTMGALSSGLVTYAKTGDVDDALSAAALGGSQGFMCGAIMGSLSGGTQAAMALHNATLKGLTMNQAAMIQKESGFPLDVISEFHSMDEYNVFKQAGLKAKLIDGKTALIRTDIDLTSIVDDLGRTNLQRMLKGLAPLDPAGNPYQLHHIGQEANATLAMLTNEEHKNAALHLFKEISEIDRKLFDKQRAQFYKEFAKLLMNGA